MLVSRTKTALDIGTTQNGLVMQKGPAALKLGLVATWTIDLQAAQDPLGKRDLSMTNFGAHIATEPSETKLASYVTN